MRDTTLVEIITLNKANAERLRERREELKNIAERSMCSFSTHKNFI